MQSKFTGTGVALVTPFKEDLSVDHEALKNIVTYNIENGTDYLVISGTTGESVTITKAEKKAIINTVKETNQSEEHTSELQSRENLVCRLLLEKKKNEVRS